jgi:endonuclease/exonuclease/phosphatase family metal-dependent hydrolase
LDTHYQRLRFIADNADSAQHIYREKHKIVELSLFKYTFSSLDSKEIFIVSVYRHSDLSKEAFRVQLKAFLERNLGTEFRHRSVLVLGDFNIDFDKPEFLSTKEYMKHELELKRLLKKTTTFESVANKAKTQPDCLFRTNRFGFKVDAIQTYKTYFSDHHAIWFEVDFESHE